jgi:hypothetical protein
MYVDPALERIVVTVQIVSHVDSKIATRGLKPPRYERGNGSRVESASEEEPGTQLQLAGVPDSGDDSAGLTERHASAVARITPSEVGRVQHVEDLAEHTNPPVAS